MSLTRRAFLFLGSIFLFPVLHAYAKVKRYITKIDPKTGYYILSPEQIACIQKRIQLELKLNPFYVWGAAGLAPGAPGDCSGKMYAIFFCCGVPVQRVTAAWMGKGLGGWKFPRVEYEKGKRLAIVIMTTQKHRPDGHVGIALEDVYGGSTIVANASSRYGFITMVVERTKANRLKMYMKQTVQ